MDSEEVPAIALKPGDFVLVRAGEIFPADGRIVQGDTEADESLLTGESTPMRKGQGDTVVGAALNCSSPVVVRVEHVGEDTRVSSIRRLVESASMQRPEIAATADRVAGWLVGTVLLVAAVAALVWWHVDSSRAVAVAVAVLVVSCPCALSLATPAAMTVAVGLLARRGVVVVKAHAIEALADATHVVFDKTGTLTEGQPGVVAVHPWPGIEIEDALALAAALERTSEHPIGIALVEAAAGAMAVEPLDVRNQPGAGIEAHVDGVRHRLGTSAFVAEIAGVLPPTPPGPENGATRVWLGREGAWLATFDLVDRLRPEAATIVRQLRDDGRRVLIWSGDSAHAVAAVAQRLDVDSYAAALLPEDKLARMVELQRDGAVVAMVGDGVNDAPVLAQAQLSIAMGSGALVSQANADIVLLSGRLTGLVDAFALAARTRRVVYENLAWAAAYNLAALPLAAAGLVSPWIAGLGMGASSLLVVLNALRIASPRSRVRLRSSRRTANIVPAPTRV
jgi:Cu2+-exporting ATPase